MLPGLEHIRHAADVLLSTTDISPGMLSIACRHVCCAEENWEHWPPAMQVQARSLRSTVNSRGSVEVTVDLMDQASVDRTASEILALAKAAEIAAHTSLFRSTHV